MDEEIIYVSTLQSIRCLNHALPSQKPQFTVLETRWMRCYSVNGTNCRWWRIARLNIHPLTRLAITVLTLALTLQLIAKKTPATYTYVKRHCCACRDLRVLLKYIPV